MARPRLGQVTGPIDAFNPWWFGAAGFEILCKSLRADLPREQGEGSIWPGSRVTKVE